MKRIKTLIVFVQLIFLGTNGYSANNCVYDIRIRSIDQTFYVKELVLFDFDNTEKLGETVAVNLTIYSDDGRGFDRVAGDHVYTSNIKFRHDDEVPYEVTGKSISKLNHPYVSKDFNKIEELMQYARAYSVRDDSNINPTDILFYSCNIGYGSCGCLASTSGACDCCCIYLYDCTWGIGLSL